jgi:hypothetical protein
MFSTKLGSQALRMTRAPCLRASASMASVLDASSCSTGKRALAPPGSRAATSAARARL